MADTFRFHADHVGSLLRPQGLLEARRRVEAGMIEPEELRQVENEAITAAYRLQKDAGLTVFTDGEFRRSDFRSGFMDAVDGFQQEIVESEWHGPDGVQTLPTVQWVVADRLRQHRRITEGDVAFMRTLTAGGHLKFTLIAPGFLAERYWKDGVTDKVYESREELGAEITAIVRNEIEALFAEGVIYVQLDNPSYTMYTNTNGGGESFRRMLSADAAAVDGVERPGGALIALHVCRGNRASMWRSEGDYEPIAEELFSSLPVDRFVLEFNEQRSGDLDCLRFMPQGKTVALGLVDSKSPALEDIDALQQRIDRAATFVPIDDLALCPMCGFASVAANGNKLTPEDEFKKLRLVADTAIATWGFEA